MNIEVISTDAAFRELENVWRYIFEHSGSDNLFISWEWCSTWWKYFSNNNQLLILLVKDGHIPVGIAPFVITKGNQSVFRRSAVRFFGGNLADYVDFLVLRDNEKVIKAIIDYLLRFDNYAAIDFHSFPKVSPNLKILEEHLKKIDYKYFMIVDSVSPFIRINGTWDDYYRSLSSGFRRGVKSFQNKAYKNGKVSFGRYEKDLDFNMNEIFRMHTDRQAYKTGKSIFKSQRVCDFVTDLTKAFSKQAWLDLSALRLNGNIISAVYAFKYKKTFYYWVPVIDPLFIKYAPGKIHLRSLIEECFKEGYKTFDFMVGDEPYKFHWTHDAFENYKIKIYRDTMSYKMDVIKYFINNRLRNLKNSNPLLQIMWKKISKL